MAMNDTGCVCAAAADEHFNMI